MIAFITRWFKRGVVEEAELIVDEYLRKENLSKIRRILIGEDIIIVEYDSNELIKTVRVN